MDPYNSNISQFFKQKKTTFLCLFVVFCSLQMANPFKDTRYILYTDNSYKGRGLIIRTFLKVL